MAALGTELHHGSGWCWATISPGFMRQIDLISGPSRCGYEALILGRDVGCTAKDFPCGLRFAAVLSRRLHPCFQGPSQPHLGWSAWIAHVRPTNHRHPDHFAKRGPTVGRYATSCDCEVAS
jgi:hypothetical protein